MTINEILDNFQHLVYKYKKVIFPSLVVGGVGLLGYLIYNSSEAHDEFVGLADLNGDGVVDNDERAKVYDVLERNIPVDLDIQRQYINRVGE